MEQLLTLITTVVLLVGWLALELLLWRKVIRGTVVGERSGQAPLAGLIASDVVVRLDDGREVTARASGCVRCQGGLAPGCQVSLLRQREGYVVALPWLRRRVKACEAGK